MEDNSRRSIVQPAEHEREQIGGGAGCRAAAGSGGISCLMTEGGGKVLGVAPQLASSAAQAISISLGSQAGVVSGIEGLLSDLVAAGPVGAQLLQSLGVLALLGLAVLGKLAPCPVQLSAGLRGLSPQPGAPEQRGQQRQAQQARGAAHGSRAA